MSASYNGPPRALHHPPASTPMNYVDRLESYMLRMDLTYEQLQGTENTWVIDPGNPQNSAIVLRLEDPIVLFSAPVFECGEQTPNREELFQLLLALNEELLHASYSLRGNQIVLSGAYQVENLDFGEFQAMIDDMSLSLDTHLGKLDPWRQAGAAKEAN